MAKPIGISAGIVAVAAPIILAVYEVMGWKMPTELAITIIVVTSTAALIALLILLHAIWVWARPIWSLYALQYPIYRKDKPNPLQWLLDMVEKQKDNPITHLFVTERICMSFNHEAKRPFLRLRIVCHNAGINDLVITAPEGYASYRSEQLPDKIESGGRQHYVPAGGHASFDLDVYIPPQFLQDVCEELDSPMRELRNLGLQNVPVKVCIKDDDTHMVGWNLGNEGVIYRRNW